MSNLKYQDDIDDLDCGCDLSGFSEQNREAFRWTFEEIEHPNNFKPVFAIDEKRKRNTCKGWGLSFFFSKASAIKRLKYLTANKPFLFKKLGTHVAQGKLDKEDGISDKKDNKGHFTHFDYKDVNLSPKFTIIEKVG